MHIIVPKNNFISINNIIRSYCVIIHVRPVCPPGFGQISVRFLFYA